MEFIYGFLFGWFLLGCLAVVGLERDWHTERVGFWVLLSLPAIPVVWLVFWLRDLFR